LHIKISSFLIFLLLFSWALNDDASELVIGTATADISPKLPVALAGQFNMRIAKTAATPLSANVVALESRDGNKCLDLAIMVSCDLVEVPNGLLAMVRNEVHQRIPDLDVQKIFLNAIHTHTAPVIETEEESSFGYPIPKKGVTQIDEYRSFFSKRVADAIEKAWKNRQPGSVTWGLSHAVIGYNRRASYENGKSLMYGKTNVPEMRNFEGYEDHNVNSLFFWNKEGKLIAMNIEVACPAQEVENDHIVNADYWHPVRMALKKKYGNDLVVLGWIGAAGDQSPHLMYRKDADDRMRNLRKMSRLEEISRRLVSAVDDAYETVKEDRHSEVKLVHKVESLPLPIHRITEEECEEARTQSQQAADLIKKDPGSAEQNNARMKWYGSVVKRYEDQKKNPDKKYNMELHVLRLGDVAICTNEFELFTDYGIRMQSRSKALQTFVIQLVGSSGYYLPTEKAVKGGHYSAIVESYLVGPEGGQVLVDRTVDLINEMFPEAK
jgi:hypothetical protein